MKAILLFYFVTLLSLHNPIACDQVALRRLHFKRVTSFSFPSFCIPLLCPCLLSKKCLLFALWGYPMLFLLSLPPQQCAFVFSQGISFSFSFLLLAQSTSFPRPPSSLNPCLLSSPSVHVSVSQLVHLWSLLPLKTDSSSSGKSPWHPA